MTKEMYRRGEIYIADLPTEDIVGSEQGGTRPVIIIQNNCGNKYSPCVIVACITAQRNKTRIPTHVEVDGYQTGVTQTILFEQIKTIDKSRLNRKVGYVPKDVFDHALRVSLDLH